MTQENQDQRMENLGPAERLIQTLLTNQDHMVHNRPGVCIPDARKTIGVRWVYVTHKVEDGQKVVYELRKVGKKTQKVRMGIMDDEGVVRDGARVVGTYRKPGLFPEVAQWMYQQVADIWQMDNEFAARWASYAFGQEHRDMKVVLAAFMLVQNRMGEPIREDGEILFHDDDYRDVGEAMILLRRKDKKDLNPKLLLRVGDLLDLDEIAEINRTLGFGRSARNPALGRYKKAVEKWLRNREQNLPMLQGLVKAGFRTSVIKLAQRVGFKPETEQFFQVLRWKQKQAKDGRRAIAIGMDVAEAESWDSLTEAEICERIVVDKPNYKRIAGLVPASVGITRAVMAAAIEAGSLSNADLIILSPTLEDLGLLEIPDIKARWKKAMQAAEDQRAANIAKRMKGKENQEALQEASDTAAKKAIEEVTRGMRIYFMVDISASMGASLERAKELLSRFVQGFPMDRIHICVFNTRAQEVTIQHASAAGVTHAFKGKSAGGGTTYGCAIDLLGSNHRPAEDEDLLLFWVGDQDPDAEGGMRRYGAGAGQVHASRLFTQNVQNLGLNPVGCALLEIEGGWGGRRGRVVDVSCGQLGIPCFKVTTQTFEDPYNVTRTIRNLLAATPVGQVTQAAPARRRYDLVRQILDTELLQKPVWAG